MDKRQFNIMVLQAQQRTSELVEGFYTRLYAHERTSTMMNMKLLEDLQSVMQAPPPIEEPEMMGPPEMGEPPMEEMPLMPTFDEVSRG